MSDARVVVAVRLRGRFQRSHRGRSTRPSSAGRGVVSSQLRCSAGRQPPAPTANARGNQPTRASPAQRTPREATHEPIERSRVPPRGIATAEVHQAPTGSCKTLASHVTTPSPLSATQQAR
eukprot:43835-Chlamydomonas_euryale.AAC.4